MQIVISRVESSSVSLKDMSVAGCYNNVIDSLKKFRIEVKINTIPNEMVDSIPFYIDSSPNKIIISEEKERLASGKVIIEERNPEIMISRPSEIRNTDCELLMEFTIFML